MIKSNSFRSWCVRSSRSGPWSGSTMTAMVSMPAYNSLDEQWAHQIAQVRSTLCAATRHRHGDSHRID